MAEDSADGAKDLQARIFDIEVRLLLEAISLRYGYDFREYSPSFLNRAVGRRVASESLPSVSALQEKVLRDAGQMNRLLDELGVGVTSFFRDPPLFRALKTEVIPALKSWPFIRVWHVGCSTGEEVYSVAILLHEAGLLERSRIYGSDMNSRPLKQASQGVFSLSRLQKATENYLESGGEEAFSSYYTARYEKAVMRDFLKSNIVFAQHNLTSDSTFNEFQLIFCSNVMIYFAKPLQEKAFNLIHSSLCLQGYLVLGGQESLGVAPSRADYTRILKQVNIYRKDR